MTSTNQRPTITMDNTNDAPQPPVVPNILELAAEETKRLQADRTKERKRKDRIYQKKKKMEQNAANAEDVTPASVVRAEQANRLARLKMKADFVKEQTGQYQSMVNQNTKDLSSRLREDEAMLAATHKRNVDMLQKDIDEADRKDRETREALFLLHKQDVGGGILVKTPGPTPSHSRSSSRSASPVSGHILTFATPAKKAKTEVVLSPVLSVCSDESDPNKMCLFVFSGMDKSSDEPLNGEMVLTDLPLDIMGISQVRDCTCFLLGDGTVVPAVHYVPGRVWGGAWKTGKGEHLPFPEPIIGIQSSESALLAVSSTGAVYLVEYRSKGLFGDVAALDVVVADGSAVAIGPNLVHWFGKELHDPKAVGTLCALPLDGTPSAVSAKDTGNTGLPMLRVKAKIATGGSGGCLILAFDQKNNGKLYKKVENGEIKMVSKFQNGTVKDVAANSSFGFVLTTTGEVSYSDNTTDWYMFDQETFEHTVQKLSTGDTFALGATLKDTILVMKPPTGAKTENEVQEWDLGKLADSGTISKVAFLDGSASFACVLAKVKFDDAATTGKTAETTDTTD